MVSILVGLSVLMAPYLRLVPMAVLFGVFLYMGISSIDGVQFFERLKLFLMPVKHHPQTAYVRKVSKDQVPISPTKKQKRIETKSKTSCLLFIGAYHEDVFVYINSAAMLSYAVDYKIFGVVPFISVLSHSDGTFTCATVVDFYTFRT